MKVYSWIMKIKMAVLLVFVVASFVYMISNFDIISRTTNLPLSFLMLGIYLAYSCLKYILFVKNYEKYGLLARTMSCISIGGITIFSLPYILMSLLAPIQFTIGIIVTFIGFVVYNIWVIRIFR